MPAGTASDRSRSASPLPPKARAVGSSEALDLALPESGSTTSHRRHRLAYRVRPRYPAVRRSRRSAWTSRRSPQASTRHYDVNAVIEIPQGGEPVKYELDKASGRPVRRPLPAHGDVLPGELRLHPAHAVGRRRPLRRAGGRPTPVVPGAVVRCRPIGALMMEDEAGGDEKILAVPVDALHPFYSGSRAIAICRRS